MNSKTSLKIGQFDGSPASELQLTPARKCEKQSTRPRQKRSGRRFLLTLCLFAAACSTQAQLIGNVAHWKFNDGLNDETGNHNGSMVDPSQSPTYVPGVDADCLQIFNQGTAVECANPNTFLRAHSFTMSVWFNATASGGNGEILLIWKGSKVKWGLPGGTQFEAYTGGGNVGAGNGIFIYTTDCGAFGENYTNENINVIDGNWHHAAVTYSTTTTPHFTLYLDGIGKDGTDPETMASLDTDFVMAADVVEHQSMLARRDAGQRHSI